jgi:hypothetical protein
MHVQVRVMFYLHLHLLRMSTFRTGSIAIACNARLVYTKCSRLIIAGTYFSSLV